MRRMVHRLMAAGAAFAAMGAIAGTSACFPFYYLDDCEKLGSCPPTFYSASASGSGSDGGPDPACVPSQNASGVSDNCGVFVSSSAGDDGNEGSKEKPVATLKAAIELAQAAGKPVYACAEELAGGVEVPAGVEIYGGLDCKAGWAHVGATTKTTIAGGADEIAVRFLGGAMTTRLEDVKVSAADAMAPGGSSVAVIAEEITVELTRCEIAAGAGKDGAKGETPTDPVGPSDPNDAAIKGAPGAAACMGLPSGNPGGAGAINLLCNTSRGGDGGKGTEASGDDGIDGKPLPDPNPDGAGLGGTGQMASGCKPGEQGANGAIGTSGTGATEIGSIDATGYVGAASTDGAPGSPAQGGGGGGGAKGKVACNGASGGGGGAGGCGGGGGRAGKPGGSSIALISLNANLLYEDVVLRTVTGGNGGFGGDGQTGGKGGNGGDGGFGAPDPGGTPDACNGGKGGQGGSGGKGGGGRGGHSIGIAYKGEAPSTDGATMETGDAGLGGLGVDAAGNGANGVKADTYEFP
jgi:hypothetical protein